MIHGFQAARYDASPAEFARWAGAVRTITGTLADLGGDRFRVVLQILGPDGHVVHEGSPVTGGLIDLAHLRTGLLATAAEGLGLPVPQGLPTTAVSSPLAFLLHAQALREYARPGARPTPTDASRTPLHWNPSRT